MDGGLHQWCTNLPFGDAQNCTGSDPSPRHFTGKERDSESGLDEFGARYYSSSMGRFMTPDWAAKPTSVPYANFGNPQSLNLYSYVENNPTTTGDPDGHGEWYDPNGRHLGTDGVNDGRVVIQNASAVSYSSDHSLVDVAGSGIPMYDISGHVGNAIQDSVSRTLGRTGSDTQGGFHEEGFTVDSNGVHNAAPGPAYRPGDDEAHINLTINSGTIIIEHTHPAGTTDPSVVMGGTHFNQEPSTMHNGKPGDIQNVNKDNEVAPGAMHIVAGAGDNTVRFYNQNGTQARVPLNAFPRCENGNNCH
ncbi:MAG: RHS repeat-associated core domain-containing protein [Acidobacteriia bacterium]|nr:RHS repeat-associated core domain-containing protein [Terriglobia bacterium]